MARSRLSVRASTQLMLVGPAPARYAPDLRTPIATLRDAVAMQCERAQRLLEQAMQPLRRVA